MSHDLELYNTQTLQELYAVAYWKVYNKFPKYEAQQDNRKYLIHHIKALQYHLKSKGD